jgi:hypothetical protein
VEGTQQLVYKNEGMDGRDGLECFQKSSDRIIKNRGGNEEERETTPS